MLLPDTFQFNQSSLQDYVDCPRRFQLRFVLMQPWPGLITDSPARYEQHLQRGADFHRLAYQHALGLDAGHLAATIHDPTLARWWRTYLHHQPSDLPHTVRRAEAILAAPLAGYRIMAKLDLLAVEPGERLVVVDWKTVLKRPQRTKLARRLQTRVYRYLAVEAGADFNGGQRPRPEHVEMIYWFAGSDGDTERFPYDADQHAADRGHLAELISEIAGIEASTWPLTPHERTCRFCNYRSLCDRGVRAGFLDELEEDIEPGEMDIVIEQVAEIEF